MLLDTLETHPVLAWGASLFNRLPPFRGKQRLFHAVFNLLPFRVSRSYYGVQMMKNMSDSTYRACMVGSYGTFLSDLLDGASQPFLFVDIGSNQGLYSLIACNNVKCVAAIAMEPNPSTFALLVSNARANSMARGKTVLICAGLADQVGLLQLQVPRRHSGAGSFHIGNSVGDTEQISAFTINGQALLSILDRYVGVPIFLKVDVEGAEPIVLRQLSDNGILSRATTLVVEINRRYRQVETILDCLSAAGWVEQERSGSEELYDALYVPEPQSA